MNRQPILKIKAGNFDKTENNRMYFSSSRNLFLQMKFFIFIYDRTIITGFTLNLDSLWALIVLIAHYHR